MLLKLKENTWLMGILLGVFGLCASIMLSISDLFNYDVDTIRTIVEKNYMNFLIILSISGLFAFVLTFVSYVVGKKLSKVVKISSKKESKRFICFVILGTFLFSVFLFLLDIYLYTPNVSEFRLSLFNVYNLFSTLIYNGFIEELWFRYGLTTFFIFIFYKVFSKHSEVSKKYYVLGAIFVSLLLFAFQLNSVFSLYTFNMLLLLRAVIHYLIMNLILTYFYLKHGLKWSIIVHVLFILFYIGLIPLLFMYI